MASGIEEVSKMLESISKKDLVEVCRQLGLEGYSSLNKKDLVDFINKNVLDQESQYAPVQYKPRRTSSKQEQILATYAVNNRGRERSKEQVAHLEILSKCYYRLEDIVSSTEHYDMNETSKLLIAITKMIESGELLHRPVKPALETKSKVENNSPSSKQLAELERLSKLTGIKINTPETKRVASEIITKLRKKEWQLKQIAASKKEPVLQEVAVTEEIAVTKSEDTITLIDKIFKFLRLV